MFSVREKPTASLRPPGDASRSLVSTDVKLMLSRNTLFRCSDLRVTWVTEAGCSSGRPGKGRGTEGRGGSASTRIPDPSSGRTVFRLSLRFPMRCWTAIRGGGGFHGGPRRSCCVLRLRVVRPQSESPACWRRLSTLPGVRGISMSVFCCNYTPSAIGGARGGSLLRRTDPVTKEAQRRGQISRG